MSEISNQNIKNYGVIATGISGGVILSGWCAIVYQGGPICHPTTARVMRWKWFYQVNRTLMGCYYISEPTIAKDIENNTPDLKGEM